METNNLSKDIKPDLKHDTMEYAASTDGEDILDMDNESLQEIEEEDISADELQSLDDDITDNKAFALNSVETDRYADNDTVFNETYAVTADDNGDDDKMPRK